MAAVNPEAEVALPERIVIGTNGAYWRDYGDHYSMCPVSEDNEPVEIVASYVPTAEVERLREALRESAQARHTIGHLLQDETGHLITFEECDRAGCIAARAALASEPAAREEVAWLVERGQAEHQTPTVWWTGDAWTTDATAALRFGSRSEAEHWIELASPIPSNRPRFGRAVEHAFVGSEPAAPAPLTPLLSEVDDALTAVGIRATSQQLGMIGYHLAHAMNARLAQPTEGEPT